MKNFFSDKELFSFDNENIKYYNNGKYILSKILINVDINFANLMEINSNVIKDDISLNSLKNELNNTIFPCYLLKNRYNNNFFIANL